MPTDAEILGFSNQWYQQAMQYAIVRRVSEDMAIRLVTTPYFLATKINAFLNRCADDFIASHDMENIIPLPDGRSGIAEEIRTVPEDVKEFLSRKFREYLNNGSFLDALPGHLLPDFVSQRRISVLMKRIKEIADL